MEMIFAQICALNGLKLSGALEDRFFYHFTIFGFKNAEINCLKKISVLIAAFIELKNR